MYSLSSRALLSLILACTLAPLPGASTSIGLATATGTFHANHSQVTGNATLFDGSIIETSEASSRLRLDNGAQVLLGVESRAKVFQARLVLEKGAGQLQSSAAYPLEARSLSIASASPGAVARVRLSGSSKVLVAAVKGSVRVTNSKGVLVASLTPGRSLTFDPQAGATGPTRATGTIVRKGNKFILTDETTGVTLELQGTDVEKYVGKRVEIMGAVDNSTSTVAGATQVINVRTITVLGQSKPAGAGLTTGQTVAIVGGVAAAGTIGGMAATGVIGGKGKGKGRSR